MKYFPVFVFLLFPAIGFTQTLQSAGDFYQVLGVKDSQEEIVLTKNLTLTIPAGKTVSISPTKQIVIKSKNNSTISWVFENEQESDFDEKKTTLLLRNLSFSGFNQLIFTLKHPVELEIDSCSFTDFLSQSIKLEYTPSSKTSFSSSSIQIHHNRFEKSSNFPSYAGSTNHIYISRDYDLQNTRQKHDAVFMEQISIHHNRFQFLYLNKEIKHLSTAISFTRIHDEDYIRAIQIDSNEFELNNDTECYFPVMGIAMANKLNQYGQNAERPLNYNVFDSLEMNSVVFRPLYLRLNDSISVTNNAFKTKSKRTREAIFMQGPFRDINIADNIIDGFGAYMWNTAAQQAYTHGAIEFYGGRDKAVNGANRQYSDDFMNLRISGNSIHSRSAGIRITGVHQAELIHNTIELIADPELIDGTTTAYKPFTKPVDSVRIQNNKIGIFVSTGGWDLDSRTSSHVRIAYNSISSQGNLSFTDGIQVFYGKEISVESNTITGITGYGIYVNYALRENQLSQLQSYSIVNNVMDYDIELLNRSSRFIAHDAFFASRLSGIRLFSKLSTASNPELANVKDQLMQSNFILAPVNAQQVLFDSFFMDDITVE